MRVVVFDTETTDLVAHDLVPLSRQPKIIEFAAVAATLDADGEGEITGEISELIYPGEKITDEITKITNISNSDLVGKPVFSFLADRIGKFMAGGDAWPNDDGPWLVGHNVMFDQRMCDIEFRRAGFPHWMGANQRLICTVELTEHMYGFRRSLGDLYADLFAIGHEGAHRALVDVKATLRVFRELVKRGIV